MKDLRISYFWKEGDCYGFRKSVLGDGAHGQADAAVTPCHAPSRCWSGRSYNIVDQIFIGWGVGYLGNGATNVVFPLTVLALGLAVMIGDGACSYVSICFGRNQPENANRAVGSAVTLSVLVRHRQPRCSMPCSRCRF